MRVQGLENQILGLALTLAHKHLRFWFEPHHKTGSEPSVAQNPMWVVVRIMVPFWVPNFSYGTDLGYPKKGP